ncbi:tetratricopeptide repeat protein [Phyllobacterium ifriqiyense]|uniref:tetratricopeptide repeat protein n=1 Tax=Phyllobacterium TaxID=28100 RepID=UPI003397B520
MTDDGFFREVNEELRSDKMRAFWARYSTLLIGGVVAIVIGTAGFAFYEYWTEREASKSGDQFLAALNLVRDGKNDEALKTLDQLEKDGYGAYPVLARMRAAGVIAQKGDFAGAVAAFDKVSADTSVPQAIRDLAKLRAALILVDTGSYDDVASRVEALSSDSNPMRHSAREALGLAAWKAGRGADATKLFKQISDDQAAPANIRQFADTMLDMLKSTGATPAAAAG